MVWTGRRDNLGFPFLTSLGGDYGANDGGKYDTGSQELVIGRRYSNPMHYVDGQDEGNRWPGGCTCPEQNFYAGFESNQPLPPEPSPAMGALRRPPLDGPLTIWTGCLSQR